MILISTLAVICFSTFGLAWAIADSKLTFRLRTWLVKKFGETAPLVQFLECPACLSFWIGLVAGFFTLNGSILCLVVAFSCVAFSTLAWAFVSRGD